MAPYSKRDRKYKWRLQKRRQERKLRGDEDFKERGEMIPVTLEFVEKVLSIGYARRHRHATDIAKSIGLSPKYLTDMVFRLNTYANSKWIAEVNLKKIKEWMDKRC